MDSETTTAAPPPPPADGGFTIPPFALSQLLMFVALVAIGFALLTSDGCGDGKINIGSIEFFPDGQRLLVTTRSGRVVLGASNSGGSQRFEIRNPVRLIAAMSVADGSTLEIIDFHRRSGHEYSGEWPGPGDLAWCSAAGRAIVFLADDDGEFWFVADDEKMSRERLPTGGRLGCLAVSPGGEFALVNDEGVLSAFDLVAKKKSGEIYQPNPPFQAYDDICLSQNAKKAAIFSNHAVAIFDPKSGAAFGSIPINFGSSVYRMAFLPDDSLLISDSEKSAVYDQNGAVLQTFREDWSALAVSPDGRFLAGRMDDSVVIIDRESYREQQISLDGYARCMAYSPDGRLLAIGLFDGTMTMVNAISGEKLWTVRAPNGLGVSWMVPAIAAIVWWKVWKRLERRRGRAPGSVC